MVNETLRRDLENLRRLVLSDRLDHLVASSSTDELRAMLRDGFVGISRVSPQDLMRQALDFGLDRRAPELMGRLAASLGEKAAAGNTMESGPHDPAVRAAQAMWAFASVLVGKHGEDGDCSMTDAEHEQWREAAGLCHDAGVPGSTDSESEAQRDREAHQAESGYVQRGPRG